MPPTTLPASILLQLAATAAATASPSQRTITGLAAPYGPVGMTNLGPITFAQGALTWESPGRVKLLRQHDHDRPIGYATALEDLEDGLHAAFTVPEGDQGDLALIEAANGIRDGLSVGVALSEASIEELIEKWIKGDTSPTAVTGAVREVSQVTIPAFSDARTDGSPAEAAAGIDLAAAAGAALTLTASFTTTPPQEDPVPTTANGPATVAAAAAAPALSAASAPPTPPALPAPAAPVGSLNAASAAPARRPGRALAEAAARIAAALSGSFDAATANVALQAALADIVPDGVPGEPGVPSAGTDAMSPPAFLGELWTPRDLRRPWLQLFGSSPLTSMKWIGWKWETRPEVAHWDGNKTDIPTGPVAIVPAEGEAHRVAGGWDFDRIYIDFDTGFVEACLRAAVESYAALSDVELGAFVQTSATDAGTATSLPEALNILATALIGEGANLSGIVMAPDVWTHYLSLGSDEVPWWLKAQGTVAIAGQEADISDV